MNEHICMYACGDQRKISAGISFTLVLREDLETASLIGLDVTRETKLSAGSVSAFLGLELQGGSWLRAFLHGFCERSSGPVWQALCPSTTSPIPRMNSVFSDWKLNIPTMSSNLE